MWVIQKIDVKSDVRQMGVDLYGASGFAYK